MKAKILQLPVNDNQWRGWLTIELENGIPCGIRNDHVLIPFKDLKVGMSVKVTFQDNGNIDKVDYYEDQK